MKLDLVVTGYVFSDDKVLLIHHNKLNKWLGVGGHINPNETPDDALKREVKEETNLTIEILNQSQLPIEGNVIENLATPFYVNVHEVGDHNHCSLFYVCRAIDPEKLMINPELKNYKWFTESELEAEIIPIDVKNQVQAAFKLIKEHNK